MNANTTPLAPRSWTCGKNMKLITPVTSAVAKITKRILRQNVERFDEVADDFSRRQVRGRAFAVIFELEKACERLIAQHETRGK